MYEIFNFGDEAFFALEATSSVLRQRLTSSFDHLRYHAKSLIGDIVEQADGFKSLRKLF
jgi:hypothetical protein